MQRITMDDLNAQLALYGLLLRELGIDSEGIALIEGSKKYGNSFKLVRIVEGGGHSDVPGAYNGFLGWTKREAYMTMSAITRTLGDVSYHLNN